MMTPKDFMTYVFAGNDSYPMYFGLLSERNFVGYADRIKHLPLHCYCSARELLPCSADTTVMQLLLFTFTLVMM
jgi:hypothetical protein